MTSKPRDAARNGVVDYYTEAGPDYAHWSRQFNMHFGFWRSGMNMRDRESMLEQMNSEVFARIRRAIDDSPKQMLDLGCGLGAVARSAARAFPDATVVGISLVPWQIEQARRLTPAPLSNRVLFTVGDYLQSPFRDAGLDAVYALESACYAPGADKASLIDEVRRVLRPGGRVVIADAFLRHASIRNPVTRLALQAVCRHWRLPGLGVLDQVTRQLRRRGFADIVVEDISWNVAPSVLHVPATTLQFLADRLQSAQWAVSRERWDNALVSLPLLLFGLDRRASGYFIISATRR